MPTISFRVSEKEKKWMDNYARLHGINLSDAIKSVFFERLEDELDLKLVQEYQNEKQQGERNYSLEEVIKELELDEL